MANDFSSDSNCKALWRFESGAGFTADSKSTNTLTNLNVEEDTVVFKEGACSALYDGLGDKFHIVDANLSAGFPFKNGDSVKKASFAFWLMITAFPASDPRSIFYKSGTDKQCFLVQMIKVGSNWNLHFLLGYNGGSSWETIDSGLTLVISRWYHIAITYDDATKNLRFRVWDDTAGVLVGGGTVSITTTNNINVEDAEFGIGSNTAALGSHKDEFVVFNDILDDNEIDWIRQGIYPVLGTVCWGHDTGVTETNIRNLTGNWSGSGYISGAGDAERINFNVGENEESETWNIGNRRIKIQINKYAAGSGSPTIKYKDGATQVACEADSWHNYVGSFVCLGWVKVRLET